MKVSSLPYAFAIVTAVVACAGALANNPAVAVPAAFMSFTWGLIYFGLRRAGW
jgi:hypothetical protein